MNIRTDHEKAQVKMLFRRLFPQLASRRWECINLDAFARIDFPGPGRTFEVNPLNDALLCYRWVDGVHGRLGCDFSYGGYLEDRSHLWRGHYQEATRQFIHLGVDYNVHAGTDVHAIRRLVVHESRDDKDQDGGWGGRIIFRVPDTSLFVIYAHLEHGNRPAKDRIFEAGERVGVVGTSAVNGGWFPHVHVQCVSDKLSDPLDGYAAPSDDLHQRYPDPESCL